MIILEKQCNYLFNIECNTLEKQCNYLFNIECKGYNLTIYLCWLIDPLCCLLHVAAISFREGSSAFHYARPVTIFNSIL